MRSRRKEGLELVIHHVCAAVLGAMTGFVLTVEYNFLGCIPA